MNYLYTSIQLIDGDIKAVCDKREIPHNTLFLSWKAQNEVFEFANQDEIDKVFYYLTKKLGFKAYETELKQGIQITCVEIKYSKAYFKEEKESDNQDWLLTEIIAMYNAGYTLEEILTKYKITRK